jgi:hypothetical protein
MMSNAAISTTPTAGRPTTVQTTSTQAGALADACQAKADGEKDAEDKADGGVFLDAGLIAQKGHREHPDRTGGRGAHQEDNEIATWGDEKGDP